MAHAEGSVTIEIPVGEVFKFILDGTNNPHWRPGVLDIRQASGTGPDVGTVFKQGHKGPGGKRIDADYEITECKPDESIKFEVIAGPVRPTGAYKFESLGKSTRVTMILDYEPTGLAKLMGPMVNKQMQIEIATLSNLKTYLERTA